MANKARLNKSRIIDALHETEGAVYLAAKMLNCSHTTVYKYVNDYPDVKAVKEYYDGSLVDYGEKALRTAVKSNEPWAVKYVLSTKGKDRGYTERKELTGGGGEPIRVKFIDYGLGLDDDSTD